MNELMFQNFSITELRSVANRTQIQSLCTQQHCESAVGARWPHTRRLGASHSSSPICKIAKTSINKNIAYVSQSPKPVKNIPFCTIDRTMKLMDCSSIQMVKNALRFILISRCRLQRKDRTQILSFRYSHSHTLITICIANSHLHSMKI